MDMRGGEEGEGEMYGESNVEIYNIRTWKQSSCPSTDEWIKK